LVVLASLSAVDARAQNLPPQMLILPWELAPPGLGTDAFASLLVLDGHSLELPDGRHAELYRLSVTHAIGDRHFARFTQDYAGLESRDRFLWGGGRTEIQWTTRLGPGRGRRVALEAAGALSTGEEKLHPLSAGAPTLRLHGRVQWLGDGPVELWTGVSERMVSPPSESERQAPRSAFPSGRSYDAILRWSGSRVHAEALLRYDTGGLPRSWWSSLSTSVRVSSQLSLRLAADGGWGPHGARMLDHGWSFGVAWRPAPPLSAPASLE
jgi:hypothetical protein